MSSGPAELTRRRGVCLVVAAPSGAGKSTITRALLAAEPEASLSVSVTTRLPRPGVGRRGGAGACHPRGGTGGPGADRPAPWPASGPEGTGRAAPGDDFAAIGEAAELRIDGHARRIDVALDGEVVRLAMPLRFRSRPGALTVVAPQEQRLSGGEPSSTSAA